MKFSNRRLIHSDGTGLLSDIYHESTSLFYPRAARHNRGNLPGHVLPDNHPTMELSMNIDSKQLEYVHPVLRGILAWLERSTGLTFTTTSQFRMNDTGVHGQLPLRGWDLRCRNIVIGTTICAHINAAWDYDHERPGKKVAVIHGEESNLHIQLQVHPNTVRVE